MKYNRVLIKMSGEALAKDRSKGILDNDVVQEIARLVADIARRGVQVCIVNGAGNIARGAILEEIGIDRITGDYMGMLGTLINSFAIADAIRYTGHPAVVLSAFEVGGFAEVFTPELCEKYFEQGYVVVFGGGTGKPFFSTDTCATLRALQTNCQAILMAKHQVDGIYDSDPRKNPNAKFIKQIKCSEILEKGLQVMDAAAIEMIKDKNIDVRVFNMDDLQNFVRVIDGEDIGSVVVKG